MEDIVPAKEVTPEGQLNFGILAMRGPARKFVKETNQTSYEDMKQEDICLLPTAKRKASLFGKATRSSATW